MRTPNADRIRHGLGGRRQFLRWLGVGVGLFSAGARAAAPENIPIRQPATAAEKTFIERAFVMRDRAREMGDQAYGAVIVRDGIIVGQSWSRVIIDTDPTGHAEMSAIRDAARRHGGDLLVGATLYSSSHPCAMCEAAAGWVGIRSMVYGREARDAGPPRRCRG